MTKEKRFLYTRIAILTLSAGWVGFTVAGFKGFQFWSVGAGLCFWLALGLLNYPRKTSLWLFQNKRIPFLTFYAALIGSFLLLDQLALQTHLWFYPVYTGPWLTLVYGILYPVVALSLIELFYFLANLSEEALTFKNPKATIFHTILDWAEGILFLAMVLLIASGGAGYLVPFSSLFFLAILWMISATIKLGFHIARSSHLLLLLFITGVLATYLAELPNTATFEWVYLGVPFLSAFVWSVPIWVWFGWIWYTLFTFRLWVFLVLHPRVK